MASLDSATWIVLGPFARTNSITQPLAVASLRRVEPSFPSAKLISSFFSQRVSVARPQALERPTWQRGTWEPETREVR